MDDDVDDDVDDECEVDESRDRLLRFGLSVRRNILTCQQWIYQS